MASFAEMIYGGAQQSIENNGGMNLAKSYQEGAALALQVESNKQKQAAIEQQKAELENTKLGKLYDFIKDARNYNNASDRNNYLKNAIGLRNALDLPAEILPDDRIMSFGSDENMGRIYSLQMEIDSGRMSLKEAGEIARDPQQMALVKPTPLEAINLSKVDWSEAQQSFMKRQSEERRAITTSTGKDKKEEAIKDRQLTNMRARLASEFQKVNIPSLGSNIDRVDKVLGGLDNWKKGQKLPGFDGLDANVDPRKLSGSALQLRQSVQGLQNELLKMQSGTAVTDQELNNLRSQMGMSPVLGEGGAIINWVYRGFANPEAVVNGLRAVRDKMDYIEANLASGYPEVYDDFKEEYKRRLSNRGRKSSDTVSLNGYNFNKDGAQKFIDKYKEDPKYKKDADFLRKSFGLK